MANKEVDELIQYTKDVVELQKKDKEDDYLKDAKLKYKIWNINKNSYYKDLMEKNEKILNGILSSGGSFKNIASSTEDIKGRSALFLSIAKFVLEKEAKLSYEDRCDLAKQIVLLDLKGINQQFSVVPLSEQAKYRQDLVNIKDNSNNNKLPRTQSLSLISSYGNQNLNNNTARKRSPSFVNLPNSYSSLNVNNNTSRTQSILPTNVNSAKKVSNAIESKSEGISPIKSQHNNIFNNFLNSNKSVVELNKFIRDNKISFETKKNLISDFIRFHKENKNRFSNRNKKDLSNLLKTYKIIKNVYNVKQAQKTEERKIGYVKNLLNARKQNQSSKGR